MSTEPSSGEQRYRLSLAKSGGEVTSPAAPPPKKRKPPRVRVEGALTKWTHTTERLTAEEWQVVQGLRISRRDLGMEDE